MNAQTRQARAAALAITANGLLIAIQLAAGALTGSGAVLSGAGDSLLDLVGELLSAFSVRHPERRLDDLAISAQAFFLLVGAGCVDYGAVHRLIAGCEVISPGIDIVVCVVAAVINLAVASRLARTLQSGERSAALEATTADLRIDAVTSAALAVALAAAAVTGMGWIDSATSLAIGATMGRTGLELRSAHNGSRTESGSAI